MRHLPLILTFGQLLTLAVLVAGCEPTATPTAPAVAPRQQTEQGKVQPVTIRPGQSVFSPDGKRLLTSLSADDPPNKPSRRLRLVLWDVASGNKLWKAFGTENLYPVAFLPDGQTALVVDGHSFHVWDAANGTPLRSFGGSDNLYPPRVALAPDSTVAVARSSSLEVWDVAGGRCLRSFALKNASGPVVFAPDGHRILFGRPLQSIRGPSTAMRLWDIRTGKELLALPEADGWCPPLAIAPDGQRALSGRYDRQQRKAYLVVWELATGKEVRQLDLFGEAVAFTPDGQRVVVGRRSSHGRPQSEITVVEVATGRVVASRQFREYGTTTFAFSPDGRMVFTGSGYGRFSDSSSINLRLWDLADSAPPRLLSISP